MKIYGHKTPNLKTQQQIKNFKQTYVQTVQEFISKK